MSDDARLAAGIEASAFLRQASIDGGFGTILHKGDAERGTLLLSIMERGAPYCVLTRQLDAHGHYQWVRSPQGDSTLTEWLDRRRRNDPDEWQIELDVPSAERFIAETTVLG